MLFLEEDNSMNYSAWVILFDQDELVFTCTFQLEVTERITTTKDTYMYAVSFQVNNSGILVSIVGFMNQNTKFYSAHFLFLLECVKAALGLYTETWYSYVTAQYTNHHHTCTLWTFSGESANSSAAVTIHTISCYTVHTCQVSLMVPSTSIARLRFCVRASRSKLSFSSSAADKFCK